MVLVRRRPLLAGGVRGFGGRAIPGARLQAALRVVNRGVCEWCGVGLNHGRSQARRLAC